MRQNVFDGALLSGLELQAADEVNRRELELLSLGGICPWPRPSAHKPPCRVARCRRCWHRIEARCPACGNSLALVVADRETIPWATLRRRTLPSRPPSPLSLVVQVDWREQPLLPHTARELGWTDDPPPREI
jgi:hypothetical protein